MSIRVMGTRTLICKWVECLMDVLFYDNNSSSEVQLPSYQVIGVDGVSSGLMVEDTHQPPSPLSDREAGTGGCLREVV